MGAKRARRAAKPEAAGQESMHILETALSAAENRGWGNLSLVDLAHDSGVTVPELRRHYPDLNGVADAWFALALDAMLAPTAKGYDRLNTTERLETMIWRWFNFLAPHREVSADMLRTKMHAPHLHHWVPMVFDLSRLVQLWRDGAGLRAQGRQRQIEEIGLTAIFLATLADWCNDDSDAQEMTRARLSARLGRADRFMAGVIRARGGGSSVNPPKP